MANYQSLNAQCFAKRNIPPLFWGEQQPPELIYACHIRPEFSSKHPRIMHQHDDLVEIVLIYNGSGRYMIRNKLYHVQKGDLLVYNAGTLHDETPVPESKLAFFTLGVASLHLPGLKENALIPEGMDCRFSTGDHYDDLFPLFQAIFRNLSNEIPGAEPFCNSLLHAILSKVLTFVEAARSQPAPVGPEPGSYSLLSDRVIQYIDENYASPITIQSIGKALNASPYYIAHLFKDETGYSPIQYLLRRRIGEAQTLLITTNTPIVDIAGQVGYETQSYFTTQFTRYVGMPPRQHRQKYRK